MINNILPKSVAFFCIFLVLVCTFSACFNTSETIHTNTAEITKESIGEKESITENAQEDQIKYILNTRSKKIHKTTCGTGDLILPENRKTYTGDIAELFRIGYTTCGNCFR